MRFPHFARVPRHLCKATLATAVITLSVFGAVSTATAEPASPSDSGIAVAGPRHDDRHDRHGRDHGYPPRLDGWSEGLHRHGWDAPPPRHGWQQPCTGSFGSC